MALLLLAAAACGGGGETAERDTSSACVETPAETPRLEGTVTCTLLARVRTEVTGAESFTDEGTYYLAIVEFYQGRLPQTAWFANLGMGAPEDFADKQKYRVGFDIAPGTYRGPGAYDLTPERPNVEGLSSPLEDAAFLEITDLRPERPGYFRYGELVEPCTAEVTDRLTRGELECPKLGAEGGDTVSLRFRWEPAEGRTSSGERE